MSTYFSTVKLVHKLQRSWCAQRLNDSRCMTSVILHFSMQIHNVSEMVQNVNIVTTVD